MQLFLLLMWLREIRSRRKGGPGITRSDLLVINKIDLAPYVGASLEVMERDSRKMRGERPFVFTNIRGDEHVDTIVEWIKKKCFWKICRKGGTIFDGK